MEPPAADETTLSSLIHIDQVWSEVDARVRSAPLAVFLDFDGTLAPIVDDPGAASLPTSTRQSLTRLAGLCPVAVVSGRELADVERRVAVRGLWYAGSHGFEMAGPGVDLREHEAAVAALAAIGEAEAELRRLLAGVAGAVVERKRFGVAAHSRQVDAARVPEVSTIASDVSDRHPLLRVAVGRRVSELRPAFDWDKGRALGWLLDQIGLGEDAAVVYVGDDLTDEDALAVVRQRGGIGVVVRSSEHGDRPTAARYAVDGPDQVRDLLGRLADVLEESAPRPC